MDVSIIIVNYNVRDFLNNALVSVFRALEGMDGEVFVVDNASDDGSSDLVRRSFPNVRLIANNVNAAVEPRHHCPGRYLPYSHKFF